VPNPSDFEIVSDLTGTRLASEVPKHKPRPGFWKRNRRWFILAAIGAVVVWAAVRFGAPRIREALDTVSTDDAFVSGHVTNVSPRSDDLVIGVLVDQVDRVEPGQLLIRMDRELFEVALAQAQAAVEENRANLALAQAQVRAQLATARGNWFRRQYAQERIKQQIATLRADVATLRARESALKLAELDQARILNLVRRGSATQSELDVRNNTLDQARQQVKEAWARIQETRAALGLGPDTQNPLFISTCRSVSCRSFSPASSCTTRPGWPRKLPGTAAKA
jgi:membrane fusion protein (multidrug efflux system)